MFTSLKVKLQSFLEPMTKRSLSIRVESKVKKIQIKRDLSEQKQNRIVGKMEFTPEKFATMETEQNCLDDLERNLKQICFSVPAEPLMMINHQNQECQNFHSDTDQEKQRNKMVPSEENLEAPAQSMVSQENTFVTKKQNTTTPKKQYLDQNKSENTLIDWLTDNNPQFYMIKLCKDSAKKPNASDIKQKRLEEYEEEKRKTAKGKFRFQCTICEGDTSINQSVQLACTHRSHKTCLELIKWRPKMKCSACDRKSIKDLIVNSSRILQARRSSLSTGKRFSNIKRL